MSPVPNHLDCAQANTADPDSDWMAKASLIPATNFKRQSKLPRFIPAIPLDFLGAALVVGDALPLLLVALMEMRIRNASEIAIGPTIWAQVGNPNKRVRSRLLRQLSKLPTKLCTITARCGRPHLLRVGADWPKRMA